MTVRADNTILLYLRKELADAQLGDEQPDFEKFLFTLTVVKVYHAVMKSSTTICTGLVFCPAQDFTHASAFAPILLTINFAVFLVISSLRRALLFGGPRHLLIQKAI